MALTDLEGRAQERERQSWMLGKFTFSLPGPRKLPVDCECSHLKTSISTFFPFSFWFPFPGYCEPAFKQRFSCIKIEVAWGQHTRMFSGTAWSMWQCNIAISHSIPGRQGNHSGQPHVENNRGHLLDFLLDADGLHDILGNCKLAACWISHEISKMQQWHRYAVAQALFDRYQTEGENFLGQIVAMGETWLCSYEPNLKHQSNEWKHPGSPRPKKVRPTQCAVKVMFAMAYDIDGVILHIPAVPQSSSTQEKLMTLGGTEPHHSSWQCNESHCCCHGTLALLAMGDSGTSTLLTWYESMWLQSLHQSERTTARDLRWTYPCQYRISKIDVLLVYDSCQTFGKRRETIL